MKNIILFTDWRYGSKSRQLQKAIAPMTSIQNITCYRSVKKLAERLHQLPQKIAVAIFLIKNKDQLFELVALGEILDNVPIILVLPDRDRKIITKAHQLRPRFLAYADCDFNNISKVLEKMLHIDNQKYQ